MFQRIKSLVSGFCVSVFLVSSVGTAAAWDASRIQPHVTFTLGSNHLGADEEFNEFNPGIALGFTLPARDSDWIYGLEVGQYRNSHSQNSQYVLGSIERPVAQLGDETTLKLGLMAGLARYNEVAQELGRKGVPTIGDWVLAGGATAAINHRDRLELRVGVVPAPGVADAIFTFQVRMPLNW